MKQTFTLAGLVIALCVVMGTACQTRQPEPVNISPELRRALDNLGNMVGPVETPNDKKFKECYDRCIDDYIDGSMYDIPDEGEGFCSNKCRKEIKNITD